MKITTEYNIGDTAYYILQGIRELRIDNIAIEIGTSYSLCGTPKDPSKERPVNNIKYSANGLPGKVASELFHTKQAAADYWIAEQGL